jgi:glutamyl-tRNA reductase
MELCVIGINNKSCPLYLREILTRAFEEVFGNKDKKRHSFSYILLSTCNRVEIYFTDYEIASVHVKILSSLRKKILFAFEHVLYSYFGSDVFLHLMRVTCGLDSAILGESDIQRQVKTAYEEASAQRGLSSYLHYLFQKSLKVGKYMRSSYDYSKGSFNFEAVVFSQIKAFLQDIPSRRVLFIGNSEMNRKFLPLFFVKSFKQIALYSRRGKDLALLKRYPALHMEAQHLLDLWQEYDVIISATKGHAYTLKQEMRRTDHKMLILDLSIPRSVDPQLAKDPKTTLLNIEDIASLFEEKRSLYKSELMEYEGTLQRCVERYTALYQQKLIKKEHYLMEASIEEYASIS